MILVIDDVNERLECNALKEWKLSIFNIVDKRLKFYSHNTYLLCGYSTTTRTAMNRHELKTFRIRGKS